MEKWLFFSKMAYLSKWYLANDIVLHFSYSLRMVGTGAFIEEGSKDVQGTDVEWERRALNHTFQSEMTNRCDFSAMSVTFWTSYIRRPHTIAVRNGFTRMVCRWLPPKSRPSIWREGCPYRHVSLKSDIWSAPLSSDISPLDFFFKSQFLGDIPSRILSRGTSPPPGGDAHGHYIEDSGLPEGARQIWGWWLLL